VWGKVLDYGKGSPTSLLKGRLHFQEQQGCSVDAKKQQPSFANE
jgi:hypothetical protein